MKQSTKHTVFIDGGEGTTGLKIKERFANRDDVTLLKLPQDLRKDPTARKEMLNQADYVFLCLPDQASREAVAMLENPEVKVIDASTAHRCLDTWTYGFPELSPQQFDAIAQSKRVAVPGCYATGFVSIVHPLVRQNIISPEHPVTCFGLSGYSGGGKQVIAQYEEGDKSLESPRIYSLPLEHKHIPEMQKISGLAHKPLFTPIINNYYAGMLVSVPLQVYSTQSKNSPEEIHQMYTEYYANQSLIRVQAFQGSSLPDGFLPANALENQDGLELFVTGNAEQVLVTARLDNLGKGASAQAVQCMNIMMGLEPSTGLLWQA